jgi:hypothetical protein
MSTFAVLKQSKALRKEMCKFYYAALGLDEPRRRFGSKEPPREAVTILSWALASQMHALLDRSDEICTQLLQLKDGQRLRSILIAEEYELLKEEIEIFLFWEPSRDAYQWHKSQHAASTQISMETAASSDNTAHTGPQSVKTELPARSSLEIAPDARPPSSRDSLTVHWG